MYATDGLRRTEPCILPLCTAMTTSQFIFGSCVLERYALYNINALKICSNSDKPNTHYDGNQRCYKFFPSFLLVPANSYPGSQKLFLSGEQASKKCFRGGKTLMFAFLARSGKNNLWQQGQQILSSGNKVLGP